MEQQRRPATKAIPQPIGEGQAGGGTGPVQRSHAADHDSRGEPRREQPRAGQRVGAAARGAQHGEPVDAQMVGKGGNVAWPVEQGPGGLVIGESEPRTVRATSRTPCSHACRTPLNTAAGSSREPGEKWK